MFFSVLYYLLHRWRLKIRDSTPLHVITVSELLALVTLIGSVIYLIGFFGMDFVQSLFFKPNHDVWEVDDEPLVENGSDDDAICSSSLSSSTVPLIAHHQQQLSKAAEMPQISLEDEDVVKSVVSSKIPLYSLESKLGDCKRAALIRREALQRITGKSLEGLPLEGFDYDSILGQCCEMPVGYVQLPVGIAGLLHPVLLVHFANRRHFRLDCEEYCHLLLLLMCILIRNTRFPEVSSPDPRKR